MIVLDGKLQPVASLMNKTDADVDAKFEQCIESIHLLYTRALPPEELDRLAKELKMKGPGVEPQWRWMY